MFMWPPGPQGSYSALFRRYLPPDWRPRSIELDVPRRRNVATFEDVFGCPVIFDAPAVAIRFDAPLLDRRGSRPASPSQVTLGDIARARLAPTSLESLRGVVVAQIWAQVLAGAVSIDSTALALGMSGRTLQRALHRELTEFRELTNAVRLQRAKELLVEPRASITEISNVLGYSAPVNFARAFRRETGSTPQNFQTSLSPVRKGIVRGPAKAGTARISETPAL